VRRSDAVATDQPSSDRRTVTLRQTATGDLLDRLNRPVARLTASPASGDPPQPSLVPVSERFHAANGCKTDEVALTLLAQLVTLEHEELAAASDERPETLLMTAIAMLAELEPATATEALLAAQMLGTERSAMRFLARAMLPGQTTEAIDANLTPSVRLMRSLTSKSRRCQNSKGKSGQQRVVVEHVNVEAGGQAIVGTVLPGDPRGEWRLTTMNPIPRGRGWLRNGNPPGDLSTIRRCGAQTRRGTPCAGPAMRNGRCRMHGGPSTGPRTPEGLDRSRKARWVHGGRSREVRERRRANRRRWREAPSAARPSVIGGVKPSDSGFRFVTASANMFSPIIQSREAAPARGSAGSS
jgi:hypothetical protein